MTVFRNALLAGFAGVLLSGPAMAGVFGPATASLGSFDVPTVTLTGGVDTVTLNGGTDALNSGTGTLSGTPFFGSGSGTLSFSEIPGVTIANPITGLFSFSDNHGGQYIYDLTSVTTISFSSSPGISNSIGLYLLGSMYDNNANPTYQADTTPTSLTMTFNQTGMSSYSESGSLSNPPTPVVVPPPVDVPEPASMALLGAGLVGMALVRRRAN